MAEIQQVRQITSNKAEGFCQLINKKVYSLAEREGDGRRAVKYLHISCKEISCIFAYFLQRLTTALFAETQKI